jgi:hypothetical protein
VSNSGGAVGEAEIWPVAPDGERVGPAHRQLLVLVGSGRAGNPAGGQLAHAQYRDDGHDVEGHHECPAQCFSRLHFVPAIIDNCALHINRTFVAGDYVVLADRHLQAGVLRWAVNIARHLAVDR